jgi:hypothetical protein
MCEINSDIMGYLKITRDELENLYSHDGLSRKELRHLLRITPNRIPEKLSEIFRHELNPFRYSENHIVSLRGFVHSPPKKLLETFNKFHYELTSNLGAYKLMVLSSSPINAHTSIPLIISKDIASPKELGNAQFCIVDGNVHNINEYLKKGEDGLFLVAFELKILNFDDLFSISEPVLKITDFADMVRDRFNTTGLLTKGIVYWFMSSPVYEGRVGGNSFSPISPFDRQYKCEPKVLDEFQSEILSIPLPYFTNIKRDSVKLDYNKSMKFKLKHFNSSDLNYRYEGNLERADKFLDLRKPKNKNLNSELNLSTNSLILDSIRTRPLESFFLEPLVPAKVLSHTDMPILFSCDDLIIDKSETELNDYNIDVNQLIFNARLSYPNSPFEPIDTAGAVKGLMDDIRRSYFELHELMIYGIIFNPGHKGGIGEHLTRIANSILRADHQLDDHEALTKAETLFSEMISKLIDEFSSDIKNLYYQFEEQRAERDQIKTHKLRNIVNSVLFELNNSFKDGWSYGQFEHEIKTRTGSGAAKAQELFTLLRSMKEVTELSPGLYWRITGFDRYF